MLDVTPATDCSSSCGEMFSEQALQPVRPNILFFTHRFPYPPNRGDRIRSFRLLEYLGQRANVDLISFYEEQPSDEYRAVLEKLCRRIAFIPWRKYSRWLRAGSTLICGKTMTEGLFRSSRFRDTAQKWSRDTNYDQVVCFCSSTYQYSTIPSLTSVPLIVDLVDVDSQKFFDYANVCRNQRSGYGSMFSVRSVISRIKQCLYQTEGRRLRALEVQIANKAVRTLVVSPDEAALYSSFAVQPGKDRIAHISNGVDTAFFSPDAVSGINHEQTDINHEQTDINHEQTDINHEQTDHAIIPNRLVFVGAMDYRANLDGIDWFLNEVWPSARRQNPDLTLDLVGSNPGEQARAFEEVEGVRLVGRVDDVRPYIAQAESVIVPLRVARGIQNKVLEAMAMAKPVLASPMSLQGIDAEVTQFACSCDRPEIWLQTLRSISEDYTRAQARAHEGREALVRLYQWSARLAPLGQIMGLEQDFSLVR